jgi:Sugar-specific transcriptional regulator TrmB
MAISYEALRQIPSPVGTALLELLQSLLAAFAAAQDPPALPVEPTGTACPHATQERRCCAACTTLQSAEAVLAEAQAGQVGVPLFPRSALEQQVLEVVWRSAPGPATPLQVAEEVGRPHQEVQKILQALATLGAIAHPRKGDYRYRPVE